MSETARAAGAARALVREYVRRFPDEAARALARLEEDAILPLLEAEPAGAAAEVFTHLDPDVGARLVEAMEEAFFRRLFAEMDPVRSAALLARVDAKVRQERLQALPRPLADELEELLTYAEDSAGQLMDPRVSVFRADETVGEALARIRRMQQRRITDLCLVDEGGFLQAVVSLQEVAVAHPSEELGSLARGEPVQVQAATPREEVIELLESKKLSSLPVVDFEGRLLGIIRHDALVSAAQQDATEDIQAMVGAGRSERALSPVSLVIRKRLPWLQINLGTAFLAAAVVGLFQLIVDRFWILAVFMPVVAGQAGNTGAQALAVTMRGLALREIRTRSWARVALKEVAAGFVNGAAVSLVTALAAYLYTGSLPLMAVLSISMIFAMAMAALAGASIPVVLTSLRQDPAQSASIILTTVTDVVGFMSYLGLATVLYLYFGLEFTMAN